MGHGVASALTATLGVGSLRNTRRRGGTLLEQAAAANLALLEHAERATEASSTGLLGRLDLRTGTLALVNAGHVPPYLCRAGTVTPLRAAGEPAAGPVRRQPSTRAPTSSCEPGDRLVLVTDGMLEREAATLDLVAEIAQTRALHPREATRRAGRQGPRDLPGRPRRRRDPARPGLVRRPRPRPHYGRRRGPARASPASRR